MIRGERLRLELPAVIALGSNLGDREATLREAVREINALDGVVVSAASDIVQTPAWKIEGVDEEAPAYLNAVITVRSALDPEALLDALNRIEHEHGRVRTERWGDRTLDLDIVSFAGEQVSTERLTLPHPRAAVRGFVLAPWVQVEPDAELPGLGRIDALLAQTSDDVRPYAAEALL